MDLGKKLHMSLDDLIKSDYTSKKKSKVWAHFRKAFTRQREIRLAGLNSSVIIACSDKHKRTSRNRSCFEYSLCVWDGQ